MTLKKMVINADASIREGLESINISGLQMIILVDSEGRLMGTASDGDIRRGLLGGKTLESPLADCANQNPTIVQSGTSDSEILRILKERHLHQMPVVDATGKFVELKTLDDLIETPIRPNLVVLMVGGLGSRLGELTQKIPKPMLPVGDKPILQTIVENFIEQGFRKFRFAVNYKSEIIENHFGDGSKMGCEIKYLREHKRMGTAGALSLIEDDIEHPVIVSNGDLLLRMDVSDLLDHHNNTGSDATMAVRQFEYQVPYGVVEVKDNRIQNIDEKPVQRFLIAGGVNVLSTSALGLVPRDEFFDMPTLFDKLVETGSHATVYSIDGYWLDIGHSDDYEIAKKEFSQFLTEK